MSHAAVDSEILFWFVVALTLLLLVLIGVTVWTHPGAAGSPQPYELNLPAPRPLPDPLRPVKRPPAVVLVGAAARSADAGHGSSPIGALDPELTAVRSPPALGGPPWDPAPRPPATGGLPWSPAPRPPGLVGRNAVQPLAVPGQVPWNLGAYRALRPDASLSSHTGDRLHPAGRASPNPNPRRSARIAQSGAASGGRAGAHRRESSRGAHRAGRSSSRAAGSAGRAGRHRAGVR